MRLEGTWLKTAPGEPGCAAAYPDSLTFSTGTYTGERSPGQGFVVWDAGIYRLEGARLVLGTATDELVTYDVHLDPHPEGDLLTVVDPAGCRFSYRRVPPSG